MLSCYDKFLLKRIKENELCVKCCDYNGLTERRKAQHQMGIRYRCVRPSMLAPGDEGDISEASSKGCRHRVARPSLKSSSDSESSEASSEEEIASPPRKASRPSNTPSRNAAFQDDEVNEIPQLLNKVGTIRKKLTAFLQKKAI